MKSNINLDNLIKNSPSIAESQLMSDVEMSTLEGGCAWICSNSCALGCAESCALGGKIKPEKPVTDSKTLDTDANKEKEKVVATTI